MIKSTWGEQAVRGIPVFVLTEKWIATPSLFNQGQKTRKSVNSMQYFFALGPFLKKYWVSKRNCPKSITWLSNWEKNYSLLLERDVWTPVSNFIVDFINFGSQVYMEADKSHFSWVYKANLEATGKKWFLTPNRVY